MGQSIHTVPSENYPALPWVENVPAQFKIFSEGKSVSGDSDPLIQTSPHLGKYFQRTHSRFF